MSGKEELKAQIVRLRGNTKVTQIMVSRCVKMPRGGGDVFVSLTGNYGDPNDVEAGLSLDDAKVATHLLGLEANIMAFQQARSGGILSGQQMESAIRHTKNNFGELLMSLGEDKK
tara:strand:+ start:119 stop:463 length:345 start_codon:yes stop_codon:yes gene_type:complete